MADHTYLGEELEDIPQHSVLTDNQVYRILILVTTSYVLTPNEILPLRLSVDHPISQAVYTAHDSSLFDSAQIIGVINKEAYAQWQILAEDSQLYGTTVDIRRRSRLPTASSQSPRTRLNSPVNNDSYSSSSTVALIMKGRYRFRVMKVVNSFAMDRNVVYVDGLIIDECNAQYNDQGYLRLNYNLQYKDHDRKNLFIWDGRPQPAWIYSKYSLEALAVKAFQLFRAGFGDELRNNAKQSGFHSMEDVQCDPLGYSYYLTSNLPLTVNQKQILTHSRDVTERYKRLITCMERAHLGMLKCSSCGFDIARRSDIFTVPGAMGMAGAYVNSYGCVHETVTVRDILKNRRLVLQGLPSTQDSWFPGYAWTIVSCPRCMSHLGWRFTVASDNSVSPRDIANATRSISGGILATWIYFDNPSDTTDDSITSFWGFRKTALVDRWESNLSDPHWTSLSGRDSERDSDEDSWISEGRNSIAIHHDNYVMEDYDDEED